jgi:hypothetical protein
MDTEDRDPCFLLGQLGRDRYKSNAVSGGISLSF